MQKFTPAYGNTGAPHPNYRLSESNVQLTRTRICPIGRLLDVAKEFSFTNAKEVGEWGSAPWNQHQKRPIPHWKEFEIRSAKLERTSGEKNDTIKAALSLQYADDPHHHH